MKRTLISTRTALLVALVVVLVFCLAVTVVLSANLQAVAYSTEPSATVGEIYYDNASTGGAFNQANLQTLLRKLVGNDNMQVSASDVASKLNVTNSAATAISEQNIIVEFGGIKWIAVALTLADLNLTSGPTDPLYGTVYNETTAPNESDVILTLWQASDAMKGEWNEFYYEDESSKYPSNMYGTSTMRAKVLNNGGYYVAAKDTISAQAQNPENKFAKFNMNYYGADAANKSNISKFLVAPRYVAWQKTQDLSSWSYEEWTQYGTSRNNQAWGIMGVDSYYQQSELQCYESKRYTRQWMDDLIWLPSLRETGISTSSETSGQGLWKTTSEQRSNSESNYAWLRTADYVEHYNYAASLSPTGAYNYKKTVNLQQLVRPALHLNLTAAAAACLPHKHDLKWVDDKNGNHYQQCTVDGCSYKTESTPHKLLSGVYADAQKHRGVCSECGLTVTQSHTLEIDYKKDANHDLSGHWQSCTVCGEIGKVSHNWDTLDWQESGGKHFKQCTACEQKYGESDHVLGAWQVDTQGKHYQQCAVCKIYETQHDNHQVEHVTFDSDTQHKGICKVCSTEVASSHQTNSDYTAENNHDLAGHWEICNVCKGKVNVTQHEWGGMSWQTGEGKHFKQCTTCAQRYGEGEHILQTHAQVDANCTNTGVSAYTYCGVCDTYFSDTVGNNKITTDIDTWKQGAGRIPTNSTHSYDRDWHYDGSSGHYHVCEYNPAHHTGAIAHNYNNTYYNDGQNHYQVCVDCAYETTHSKHYIAGWSTNGNESHSGQCTTCSLTVTAAHDWETTTLSYDDDGHWYGCKATSCTERKDFQAHNVTSWTNAGTKHQGNCDDCAKTGITQAHSLGSYVDDGEGNHYQKCEGCTYETQKQAHNLTAAASTSDSKHQGLCTVCKLSVTEDHATGELQHNVLAHWNECTVCNKQLNYVAHEWDNWTLADNDTHKATCGTCQEFITGEHEVATWTNGSGNHSGQCTVCHGSVTADHVLSALLNDGSGYYQKCTAEGCDYRVDYSDVGDVHVHQYNKVKFNASAHWYECECGALQNVSAHSGGEWVQENSTHYKVCAVCSQKYAEGKHSATTWTNASNNVNHTGKCVDCDKELTEKHVLSALSKDSSGYYQKCTANGCDYRVDYSDVGDVHVHQYNQLKYNASAHWYACECGALQSVAAHSGGTWVTDSSSHYKECETCRQHYDSGDHVKTYAGKDDSQHDVACAICNWTDSENHSKSALQHNAGAHWYDCSVCKEQLGYVEHDWGNEPFKWIKTDNNTHKATCSTCSEFVTGNHEVSSWSLSGSGNHSGQCTVCNGMVTQGHTLGALIKADDGYYQKCTANGCTYETEHHDIGDVHVHSYDTQEHDDVHHWMECQCGARNDVVEHDDSAWKHDGNNHYKECATCQATYGEGEHIKTYMGKDDNQHDVGCAICDWTGSASHSKGAIQHNAYAHWYDCSQCKQQVNYTVHNWDTATWTSVDSSTHKSTCATCGEIKTEKHSLSGLLTDSDGSYQKCTANGCTYETERQPAGGESHVHSYTVQKSDENYHWNECQCGARQNVTEHDWNADGWVDANSNTHKATCSVCQYSATEGHNFEQKHDDEGYWMECQDCGHKTAKTPYPNNPDNPNKDPDDPNKPSFWQKVKDWFKGVDEWFAEQPLPVGYLSAALGLELLLIIILAIAARKPKA